MLRERKLLMSTTGGSTFIEVLRSLVRRFLRILQSFAEVLMLIGSI
jgi:hypothetical protein